MATALVQVGADDLTHNWASKYLSMTKPIQQRNYPTLKGLYDVWVENPEED